MRKLLAAAMVAVATAAIAGPAAATRPCEPAEIDCHQTCTLPHYEKGRGVYWVNC